VQSAAALYFFALAAGIFETVLAIVEEPSRLAMGGGIRVAVTALASFFIVNMAAGRNWARLTLAILLGGLGTLSLVVDPIQWLLDGNSISAFLGDADTMTWLFTGSRVLHTTSVLLATGLMFHPAANRYFKRQPVYPAKILLKS
jgi:hypothetical protein